MFLSKASKVASFPGHSHLQGLIACSMQPWKGGGLGDLVTCSDVR